VHHSELRDGSSKLAARCAALADNLGARRAPDAQQVARLEGGIKEAKAATDKVQKEYNALSEKVGG
jgi:hypothetical protein